MSLDHPTPETTRTWRGHEAEARADVRKLDKAIEAAHEALSAIAHTAREIGVLDLRGRFGGRPETSEECIANWLHGALEIDTSDLIDREKLQALRNIAEGE